MTYEQRSIKGLKFGKRNEWRRLSRENCSQAWRVHKALPKDHTTPQRVSDYWDAVLNCPDFARRRADFQRTILSVVRELMSAADVRLKTTRPGWDRLVDRAGVKRHSVARVLRWLKEQGLLVVLATGRQAKYTPKSTGRTENDQAVYVLCRPMTAVEISATLHARRVVKQPPCTRAGKVERGKAEVDGAPRRLNPHQAAYRRVQDSQRDERWLAVWPGNRTVNPLLTKRERRAERLQASSALWAKFQHVKELKGISPQMVASICKPFFDAGWTVNDLHRAVDWRPDGTPWPHSGADGVRRADHWLRRRLAAWTRGGEVLRSPYQRARDRQAELRAQARAAEERLAQRKAEREDSSQSSISQWCDWLRDKVGLKAKRSISA